MAPFVAMDVGDDALVSVDIEAAGPSPSVSSMLSIGACLVEDPAVTFYAELKPIADRQWDEQAQAVHGLDRDVLTRDGEEPGAAMERFAVWVDEVCAGRQPVFVGFNAPFDWMYVADYFWRYVGRNPFGISALDLKSMFMARDDVHRWAGTRRQYIDRALGIEPDHNHNALDDAKGQARLARALLNLG